MRALGAALVLLGAAGGYLLRRREQLLPVRLGRALLEDLAVLDYQIRFRRRPLPALLAGMEGLGARWLWQPLAEALEGQETEGLPGCWARAAAGLPPPLDRYLAPLGPMVPDRISAGGGGPSGAAGARHRGPVPVGGHSADPGADMSDEY